MNNTMKNGNSIKDVNQCVIHDTSYQIWKIITCITNTVHHHPPNILWTNICHFLVRENPMEQVLVGASSYYAEIYVIKQDQMKSCNSDTFVSSAFMSSRTMVMFACIGRWYLASCAIFVSFSGISCDSIVLKLFNASNSVGFCDMPK